MLSMIAIIMLLVSKRFVYELPLSSLPTHTENSVSFLDLPRNPPAQVLVDKIGSLEVLRGCPPQTAARVYAAESLCGPTDALMTSLSYPCPHGKFMGSAPFCLPLCSPQPLHLPRQGLQIQMPR